MKPRVRRRRNKKRATLNNLSPRAKAAFQMRDRAARVPERVACPHPGKVAYPGRKEARAVAKRLHRQGTFGRIHAYRCRCGSFHLGTASLKPGPAPELP